MNHYIDHTCLRPDASREDTQKLCEEAVMHRFYAVCINPWWVEKAQEWLAGSEVALCSVVGFPLGANQTETKAYEAQELVKKGVSELDMVMNIGALKSKDYEAVRRDIQAVVRAGEGCLVKVIIETCLLSQEEKRIACLLTQEAGAHFVKTSTGFSKSGASVEDIQLMRQTVGADLGVKASGGISSKEFAFELIQAGATRIGTSKGTQIV